MLSFFFITSYFVRLFPLQFYDVLPKRAPSKTNKAVYTAISGACGWAGAVLSLCKPQNSEIRDRKLDDTDGPTDRHSVL